MDVDTGLEQVDLVDDCGRAAAPCAQDGESQQRWLAPREKCAARELENSITCDISARKFLCNASGDAVTGPARGTPFVALTEQRATRGVFFG
jgi:hypothetical protein